MYDIICENCGKIGFHPTRDGATSIATVHKEEMEHRCGVAQREKTQFGRPAQ